MKCLIFMKKSEFHGFGLKKAWENKVSAHGRTGGDGDLYRIHFRDL